VTAQRWDPHGYERHGRFVSDYGADLVAWLDPRPGERILDLGCGDGALTEKLVALGCNVVAVDSSPEFVAAAKDRGLDARLVDGERLAFDREFDAVFSNAALHWMKRPDAVISGVRRALRQGGRFVAEMGGKGNVDSIVGALRDALERRGVDSARVNPWYFPDAEEYRQRLEAGGFRVLRIERFPRPTPLPSDMIGWLETFAQSFTARLPAEERRAVLAEARDALAPMLSDDEGRWTADYVRLRFEARKS
jgi:trans-aconitate methyltransferase